MTRWTLIILVLIAGFAVAYGAGWIPSEARQYASKSMHRAVNPGPLSAAHANLANNCNACHTPVKGVDSAKCILCHANNESILQRQPTAFHASINTCKECHLEHRGVDAKLSEMDHALLTSIGMKRMRDAESQTEELTAYLRLSEKLDSGVSPHSRISLDESVLDCASCHSNDDRAQCHATDRWTVPEYKHPSPQSTDCSQCHQAPPSHYMMHFKMISARVAGKPHARVDQCGQCHQTTSWNDIKRVGWYKHH